MSRRYAEVIGDPIAHSKSPLIHNFWLQKLGIDAEYRATHVRADELEDYFARRRGDAEWLGCNITIPHKESVATLIPNLLGGYDDFGALNLVVRRPQGLFGANTDVEGVVGPLNAFHDHAFDYGPVPKRTIAVIGAGGAARAALFGLKRMAFAKAFRILVRRPEQGHALSQQLGLSAEIMPITDESLAGVDILINASPLGMVGQPALELGLDCMGGGTSQPLLFEMVYAPLETQLVSAARSLSFEVIDGLGMLVGQASSAFELLFGQSPPREHDAELRELLIR